MLTLAIMGWAAAAVLGLLAAYYHSVAFYADTEKREWRERARKLGRRSTERRERIDKLEAAVEAVVKAVEKFHGSVNTVTWNDSPSDHEGD